MKIGYARVSTEDQDPQRQEVALEPLCDEYYSEKLSATARKRPVYRSVIAKLKPGDTFVITEFSRGYRDVLDAIRQGERLKKRGVLIQVGYMLYDLSIPEMKCMYICQAAFSGLELDRLKLRTRDGMETKRKAGRHLGRISNETLCSVHAAIAAGEASLSSMAEKIGCSEDALTKGFKRLKLELPPQF